jgi:hypothetical protein
MKQLLSLGAAAIVALSLGAACGKDDKTATTTTTPAAAKEYADSVDGFRALATDWVAAAKAGKLADVKAMATDLRLPASKAWFADNFGDEAASRLEVEYTQYFGEFEQSLEGLVSVVKTDGRDQIEVRRHTDPADVTATAYQVDALRAMKKPLAFSTLQLRKAGATDPLDRVTVWSFVHVDGKYRLVGKMKTLGAEPDDEMMSAIKDLPVEDARKVLEEH